MPTSCRSKDALWNMWCRITCYLWQIRLKQEVVLVKTRFFVRSAKISETAKNSKLPGDFGARRRLLCSWWTFQWKETTGRWWWRNPRRWEVCFFSVFCRWRGFSCFFGGVALFSFSLHHTHKHTCTFCKLLWYRYKCVRLCKQQIQVMNMYTNIESICFFSAAMKAVTFFTGDWTKLQCADPACRFTGWEEKVTNSINCSKGIHKVVLPPLFFLCNFVEK